MRRLAFICFLALAQLPRIALAQEVIVFAAASLTNAFDAVARLYREQSGERIKFSFAASSTLARQIESGAQADIFAAADEQWMDYLVARKLVDAATRTTVLGNTLVLITPADRRQSIDIQPGFDLAGMLGNERLATGDPAHVPVGRYAEQALKSLRVWQAVAPKLARTENVRAALALVERGEAPFGIVYASDAAASSRVRVAGVFPEDSHAPIRYPFAIVAQRDRPEVRRFLAFLTGPEARAVYRKMGFTVAAFALRSFA